MDLNDRKSWIWLEKSETIYICSKHFIGGQKKQQQKNWTSPILFLHLLSLNRYSIKHRYPATQLRSFRSLLKDLTTTSHEMLTADHEWVFGPRPTCSPWFYRGMINLSQVIQKIQWGLVTQSWPNKTHSRLIWLW